MRGVNLGQGAAETRSLNNGSWWTGCRNTPRSDGFPTGVGGLRLARVCGCVPASH